MTPWRRPRHGLRATSHRFGWPGLAVLACVLALVPAVHAAGTTAGDDNSVSFDRSLLSGGGRNTANLSRFEKGDFILPGLYSVDLYVNNVPDGRAEVRFVARPGHPGEVTPCFTPELLQQARLEPRLGPALKTRLHDAKACVDIGELLHGASSEFDFGNLRLNISVPQASMNLLPRGYVAPDNLADGVTAALLNYSMNAYRSQSQGVDRRSAYLNLDAGVNLGRWRFRHTSSLTWQSALGTQPAQRRWQNVQSYARRDIPAVDAQLTLGDAYTDGTLFDSVGINGVMLASDERMLPSSQRGYAPVVRGVARTNAKVTVRQNGVLLYQTTVSPGPFAINDLYPTGYGGDLEVEVEEADGSVHRFSVPYASVPQLLRNGATRFELASGNLRNPGLLQHPLITEGSLRHGFSNLFTGYAGAVGTRGYFSYLLGGAFNTSWGALSLDATSARSKIPGVVTISGRSYRLSYSKILPSSNTSINVAAYRYSTSGFLGLNDAMLARDYARRGLQVFASAPPVYSSGTSDNIPILPLGTPDTSTAALYTGGIDRPRSRFSITLNQQLGANGGSLFLNAFTRSYWNRGQRDTQYQLGYNNRFNDIGVNLTATRSRDPLGRNDIQYYASISIPLGSGSHAPLFSASLSHDHSLGWQQQAIVNGSAGSDNQFNYGTTVSHITTGNQTAASINGGYRGTYAVLQASAGRGPGYTQQSLGMAGAVVAFADGVAFGQPTGNTVGIIVARHAAGAKVSNAQGVRVDRDGFALVPYLTPYMYNPVGLDPRDLPLDVQLDATSTRIAPRAGAVVVIPFRTEYGRSLIVRARLANGDLPPFGARVVEAGRSLGVVGQGGNMLLRGVDAAGRLQIHWTDAAGTTHRCGFSYTLPHDTPRQDYPSIDAVCRPIEANQGGPS